ncbi:hypothetical protein QBC43DRAFT_296910 [Cladorrhinum sp. PSN259]|nr:hypothetical protein QBC43DRAFT_296910 [Cladorrhinum sp. PSN259]
MSEPLQPTETTKPPKACQLHGVPEPQTSQQPEPSQVPGSDAQLTKYPPQPEPSSTQNRQPSFHFNPEPPREATRLPKRLCRKFMITFPYATVGLTSTFQAVLKVTWERGSRSYGPFDRVDEIIQQGDNLKHRYHFLIADVVRFPHVGTYSWHVKVFDSSLCTYRAGCDDFDRLDASWEEQCPWKTVVHEDGLGLEPGYGLG